MAAHCELASEVIAVLMLN